LGKKANVDQMKSSLERNVYKDLQTLKGRRKLKVSYESDKLPYYIEKQYIPDFTVEFPDDRVMYIEAKGWLRSEDRTKMIAVKKAHPDADIRLLFQNDNKLSKNAKSRYSDWALKHNFPFAFKQIPEEWLV
jgi:predicted nuclease of restriction endonuclease-like RecB superfamily